MKRISAIGIIVIMLMCNIELAMAQNQSSEYTVIKKPLGPLKDNSTHYIPPGSIIYHSTNGITTVYSPDGKVILKAKDSEAAKIPIPGPVDYSPATYVYHVPSGSSVSSEPFELQTEDRGLISTEEAERTYDENGTVVLTVIKEKSKRDATISLFNPRTWMEKLEGLFDQIYGCWRAIRQSGEAIRGAPI